MVDLTGKRVGARNRVAELRESVEQVRADVLAALMGAVGPRLRGFRTIALGDSIDVGSDEQNSGSYSQGSIFAETCIRSNQRMAWYRNAGIPGNRTSQCLARIQTDVIDHAPGVCIIGGGVSNDIVAADYDPAASRANLAAMADILEANEIVPVLRLTTPADNLAGFPTLAARRAAIVAHNVWATQWAQTRGLRVLDYWTPLANDDGGYITGYTDDGTHPNMAGVAAASTYLAANLPVMFEGKPFLVQHVGAPDLLNGVGLFTGTPVNGIAGGWGGYGGDSTTAVEADTAIPGNWQTISGGTEGLKVIESGNVTTGYAEGDLIMFSCRVQKLAAINSGIRLRLMNDNTQLTEINLTAGQRILSGVVTGFAVVPANTTGIMVQVSALPGAEIKVAQVGVFNLTTLDVI